MAKANGETRRIVILGGFMSHPQFYSVMKNELEALTGLDARIVPVYPLHWCLIPLPGGWKAVLKRLDRTLSDIQSSAPQARVILAGHSMGGVLGLLYLAPPPRGLKGWERRHMIDGLITLGSPLQNRCRLLHGGRLSRLSEKSWKEAEIPAALKLVCVAGRGIRGNKKGTASERRAYSLYKAIGGRGDDRGDGIIPSASAVLPGADSIMLDDVAHISFGHRPWYGSPETVSRWWTISRAS